MKKYLLAVIAMVMSLMAFVAASSALTIDFDGGSAILDSGETVTTSNASLNSNIVSYVENGVLVEFIVSTTFENTFVGDFYRENNAVLFTTFNYPWWPSNVEALRFSMLDGSAFNLNYIDVITNSKVHGESESWITASSGATIKIPHVSLWGGTTVRMTLTTDFNNITDVIITSASTILSIDNIDIFVLQPPTEPDTDEDGIIDIEDNCPMTPNSDQADFDIDGIGDVCDSCPSDSDNDGDADGICGDIDNCPQIANASQSDFDGDGDGNECDDDDDDDGVLDGSDNCQYDFNSDQADLDGDAVGDACDSDADGDYVIDADDECLGTSPSDVVNSIGCSVTQICPCENSWRNHGGYVKCVAHTAEEFVEEGLITIDEKGILVSQAAKSICGHKNK